MKYSNWICPYNHFHRQEKLFNKSPSPLGVTLTVHLKKFYVHLVKEQNRIDSNWTFSDQDNESIKKRYVISTYSCIYRHFITTLQLLDWAYLQGHSFTNGIPYCKAMTEGVPDPLHADCNAQKGELELNVSSCCVNRHIFIQRSFGAVQ